MPKGLAKGSVAPARSKEMKLNEDCILLHISPMGASAPCLMHFLMHFWAVCRFDLNLMGRATEVLDLAEELKEQHPGVADVWSALGKIRTTLGDVEGALEAHGQAADLQPFEAAHRCNIAMLLSMLGEHEKALENFRAASQLDPSPEIPPNGCGAVAAGLSRPTHVYKFTDRLFVLHLVFYVTRVGSDSHA